MARAREEYEGFQDLTLNPILTLPEPWGGYLDDLMFKYHDRMQSLEDLCRFIKHRGMAAADGAIRALALDMIELSGTIKVESAQLETLLEAELDGGIQELYRVLANELGYREMLGLIPPDTALRKLCLFEAACIDLECASDRLDFRNQDEEEKVQDIEEQDPGAQDIAGKLADMDLD
jgi:hypothetical protein